MLEQSKRFTLRHDLGYQNPNPSEETVQQQGGGRGPRKESGLREMVPWAGQRHGRAKNQWRRWRSTGELRDYPKRAKAVCSKNGALQLICILDHVGQQQVTNVGVKRSALTTAAQDLHRLRRVLGRDRAHQTR